MTTSVVGHQGGWDEILVVLGIAGLVYVIGALGARLGKRRGAPDTEVPAPHPDHRARLEERRRLNRPPDEGRPTPGV